MILQQLHGRIKKKIITDLRDRDRKKERRREGEEEEWSKRERHRFLFHIFMDSLVAFVYALTRDRTHNFGI